MRSHLVRLFILSCGLCALAANDCDAQTASDSSPEPIRAAFSKLSKHKERADRLCIKRIKEGSGIVVVGTHANDRECRFEGVFTGAGYYFEADSETLSREALRKLGWQKANQEEREKLALFWTEKGLLAFDTVIYSTNKTDVPDEVPFEPPKVASKPNGQIEVTLWAMLPMGKSKHRGCELRRFEFNPDGSLVEERAPPPNE